MAGRSPSLKGLSTTFSPVSVGLDAKLSFTSPCYGYRPSRRLRKDDLDQRFPGLMDSIITAEAKGHIPL